MYSKDSEDSHQPHMVWIIIPVHNRCATTKACLENLSKLKVLNRFQVVVVDDGSTDGTAEMLNDFPECKVLKGDGNLYWGGGIAMGMKEAFEHSAHVIVWLNDDCIPDNGSIEKTVNRVQVTGGICGGVCFDQQRQNVTYSGILYKDKGRERICPRGDGIVDSDMLNGNLVAIHRNVVNRIGVLDPSEFIHYGGDSWYTLKARQSGFKVEIDGSACAVNDTWSYYDRVGESVSVPDAWRAFWRVGSPINIQEMYRFRAKVWGPIEGVRVYRHFAVMIKYSLQAIARHGLSAFRRPES